MTAASPLRGIAQAHAGAGQTERAAQARASVRAGSLRGRALLAIAAAGSDGLTIDEAMQVLGVTEKRRYSLAPRLSELVADGFAAASRELVRGRSMAYVATDAGHDWAEDHAVCTVCHGNGGWQQHDGLIVECPRGCVTEAGAA